MAFASLAHLTRRGEVYYFRRAIPKALMPVFGRREIKVSLQTDHRPTATIRCRNMTNAFERLLERAGQIGVIKLGGHQIGVRVQFHAIPS